VGDRLRAQPPLQGDRERVPVGDAGAVRRVCRVVGEVRQPHRGREPAELPVVSAGDGELPVGAGERFVRGDRRVSVAHPLRRRAGGEIAGGLVTSARAG
jgi:hypothetical protein